MSLKAGKNVFEWTGKKASNYSKPTDLDSLI